MKRFGITSILLFLCFCTYAQADQWELISSFSARNVDKVSIDNRENVFYSDGEGNVYKTDGVGEILSQYSPLYQSKIDQLDAFSTTILFLFSKDLQQVVLLDRHLTPLNTFSLHHKDLGLIEAAGLGNGSILWAFDELGFSLKKYNYKTNEMLQVQPLPLVLTQDRIEVVEIQERQNMVLLKVKGEGIFVFDNQGNFLIQHPIILDQKLSFLNDHLYYTEDGTVCRLNVLSGEKETLQLPEVSFDKVAVSASRMIFYSADSIVVYKHPSFD